MLERGSSLSQQSTKICWSKLWPMYQYNMYIWSGSLEISHRQWYTTKNESFLLPSLLLTTCKWTAASVLRFIPIPYDANHCKWLSCVVLITSLVCTACHCWFPFTRDDSSLFLTEMLWHHTSVSFSICLCHSLPHISLRFTFFFKQAAALTC